MRRQERETDEKFARELLDRCEWAVLAMTAPDGAPYCVPVTIAREGQALYIHGAPAGRKADSLRAHPRFCLTAVGDTNIVPEKFTTEYESAVACGTAVEVTDDAEKLHALRLLCERHTPTNMAAFDRAASASLPRTAIWRLEIESLTGKRKKYDAQGREVKFERME